MVQDKLQLKMFLSTQLCNDLFFHYHKRISNQIQEKQIQKHQISMWDKYMQVLISL